MAERRMISTKIVDTDMFTDMPISSRLLYYELNWRADDDGFVSSPKKIIKSSGCSEDDLKMLVAKQFIIPFESGVILIRDWRVHNWIRGDRHHPTQYVEEFSTVSYLENNKYTPIKGRNPVYLEVCHTNVSQTSDNCHAEDRLDKDSLGKDNIISVQNDVFDGCKYNDDIINLVKDLVENRKQLKKPMTARAIKVLLATLEKLPDQRPAYIIKAIELSILNNWLSVFPIKNEHDIPKMKYREERDPNEGISIFDERYNPNP